MFTTTAADHVNKQWRISRLKVEFVYMFCHLDELGHTHMSAKGSIQFIICEKERSRVDNWRPSPQRRWHCVMELTTNPMQPEILASAPRCGAKTRAGLPCMSPTVRGKRRCRMHGGTSKGAPKGNRHGWIHGNRSAEAEAQLKVIRQADRILKLGNRVRDGQMLRPNEHDLLIQLMLEEVHFPGSSDSNP